MRSRALQTSRLLRQPCSSLYWSPATPRCAAQPLIRRLPSASLTTASKPAPRAPIKPATKAASTFTKPVAKAVAEKPAEKAAAAPAKAPEPPKAAASGRTHPPTSAAASEAGSGNGLGNGGDAGADSGVDWSTSFQGVGTSPFSAEAAQILMADLNKDDVEIKPDGIVYLPEIKYRRILNRAFGPGGWGMVPRDELLVEEKLVTREFALIAHGRFVAQARGECQYFSDDTVTTAGEGCKSNALMRCCKDIGIASELWDPRFIRSFKKTHCDEIWVEHATTKKRRQIWVRKDSPTPTYPYQLVKK